MASMSTTDINVKRFAVCGSRLLLVQKAKVLFQ